MADRMYVTEATPFQSAADTQTTILTYEPIASGSYSASTRKVRRVKWQLPDWLVLTPNIFGLGIDLKAILERSWRFIRESWDERYEKKKGK